MYLKYAMIASTHISPCSSFTIPVVGFDIFVEELWGSNHMVIALGGVVVSVLATGPKVREFKPGRGRWILRVIKFVARLSSEGK
jgi:hypothetical protein